MKMREDLRQLNTKGEVPSGTSPFAYVRMHGGGSPHLAVREQGGDPQQHDRPDDGRHEAAQRAHGHQPDEREEPPAQHAADEPHNQIDQQPRAAALDDEVRDPSGRQPQKQIPNEIHSLPFCGYGAAAAKSVPERQSALVGSITEREKAIRDGRVSDEAGEGLPASLYFPSCAVLFSAVCGPISAVRGQSACRRARASWSGHEVPRPRQSIPSRRAMVSSTFMPRTSAATPCVLPSQPPVKRTLRMMSLSSSMSICREQVPTQVWVRCRVMSVFVENGAKITFRRDNVCRGGPEKVHCRREDRSKRRLKASNRQCGYSVGWMVEYYTNVVIFRKKQKKQQ